MTNQSRNNVRIITISQGAGEEKEQRGKVLWHGIEEYCGME
jgi:hypothetical protein